MIARVRLEADSGVDPIGAPGLAHEFPSVARIALPDGPELTLSTAEWNDPDLDFWSFDRRLDDLVAAGVETIAVEGPVGDLEAVALQVLTRCQRWIGRRNRHSRGPEFDRLLEAHRRLHVSELPLVQADFDHARDTWQWTLRLDPDASAPLQAAALFHDVERLASEAEVRIEHHAVDYAAFKRTHAARGATVAARAFADAGFSRAETERATQLVSRHEEPDDDPDVALLNDADALSFFSFNSPGFLAYYGEEHARKKVASAVSRLRPGSRGRLDALRLTAAVRDVLAAVRAAEPVAPARAGVLAW